MDAAAGQLQGPWKLEEGPVLRLPEVNAGGDVIQSGLQSGVPNHQGDPGRPRFLQTRRSARRSYDGHNEGHTRNDRNYL